LSKESGHAEAAIGMRPAWNCSGLVVYRSNPQGNDLRGMPRKLHGSSPLLALLALATLLATSCGQIGAARSHPTPPDPGRLVAAQQPSPSVKLNGENNGPVPSVEYVVFRSRKVIRITKGKNPLRTCPVHGKGFFSRDFGAPRYAGGYHPHAGNDIFAAKGTPIVAPFDGMVVATPNVLGGQAVKVYGAAGYVYNAHLIGYGKLGRVKAGQVIGFVGNTGDALGGPPHDHFEFHPRNGPPVDPYPYLLAACVATRR
jgi:murein DD-endopeptidase MepM/ murein hydrolase activator NlpD